MPAPRFPRPLPGGFGRRWPSAEGPSPLRWTFPLLALAGQVLLWSLPDRGQTGGVLLGFGLATAGWLGAWRCRWSGRELAGLLLFGWVLRAAWWHVPPLLSDDWYRYVWDGLSTWRGANPFAALPSERPDFAPALLEGMNSPDYHTVYPPAAQGLFALAAGLGGGSAEGALQALRVLFLAFDGLALWLLWRLAGPTRHLLLYALAPLAVVETAGNTHLEGVAVAGVLLAAWAWREALRRTPAATDATAGAAVAGSAAAASTRPAGTGPSAEGPAWPWWALGTLGLALGIGTKLTPLALLPLLPWWLGWGRALALGGAAVALVAAGFAPFWTPELPAHFGSSLDLYFRTFEFNGGLYAALRWASIQLTGYNRIDVVGPWLGAAAAAGMLAVAFVARPRNASAFLGAAFGVLLIHQLAATTVHPWYLLPVLAFSVFSRWRAGVAWAALVPLTYTAYAGGGFHHPHGWVALEYGLVALGLLSDLVRLRRRHMADLVRTA
jgi:alpha-1,6-mannosyltransferase